MKKTQKKYKKTTTKTAMKITQSTRLKNKNSNSESIKNSAPENGSLKQKNSYPRDIQSLFERLGID